MKPPVRTGARHAAGLAAVLLAGWLGFAESGAAAASPPAPANVEVGYRDPDRFADTGSTDPAERRRTLDALGGWLQVQAAGTVPPSDRLVVTITGLSRAGLDVPSTGRPDREIRVVRDLDPTSIDLDFQLADANGAVLKEGHRRLSDLGMSADPLANRDDALGREKSLLRRWLAQEFGVPRAERRSPP